MVGALFAAPSRAAVAVAVALGSVAGEVDELGTEGGGALALLASAARTNAV